jgi:hypothetical protein
MRADRRLARNPDYDEEFIRTYTVPVEDWHWTTRMKGAGLRWFRSPNIVPIEKYRRPTAKTGGQRAA